MVDLATVGYKVDTTGLAAGEKALDKFDATNKRMAAGVEQSTKSTIGATAATQRLEAQHAKIQTTMQAATRAQTLHNVALEAAHQRAIAATGSIGSLGRVLTALGPAGLGVAVIIGIAAISLKKMADEANRLAEKAGNLVDFAQTTGFTTTQLQALNKAASQVGVSAQQLGTGLEKFGFNAEQAREGTGELFEQLLKIDPVFARQISMTKNAADAWAVYEKARAKAGETEKIVLDRAAFGRGGAAIGRVVAEVGDQKGLAKVAGELNKIDLLQRSQLEYWDKLRDQTKLFSETARDNIATVFSTHVLEIQNDMNAKFLEFSRLAKDFQVSAALRKLLDMAFNLKTLVVPSSTVESRFSASDTGNRTGMSKGLEEYAAKLRGAKTANDNLKSSVDSTDAALKKQAESAAAVSARSQRFIEFLGSAATIEDRRLARQNEINAALEKNKELTAADGARAKAINNLDAENQKLSLRASLLGELMPVEEQVLQKQNDIIKARLQGVTVTDAEAAAILRRTKAQAELNSLSGQLKFERATVFLSDEDIQIANKLSDKYGNDIPAALASSEAAAIRFTNALRSGKSDLVDFGQTFAKAMLEGKSAADAAMVSLNRIADKLLDKGIEKAITGALSGDPAAMAAGSVQALIAIGIKLFTGADARRKADQEAQARAWEAWEAMAHDFSSWTAKMQGTSVGTISNRYTEAAGEAQRFIEARSKAMGFTSKYQEDADPIIKKIREDLGKFHQRIILEFQQTFPDLINAMNSGLGPDSPLFQAMQSIRDMGEKIKELIADAETAFGKGSKESDQARKAGQEYLLAQLNPQQDMSATEKAMAELQGKAKALQEVLVSLGMSSEEAARRINEGVKKSIDALKKAFGEDLQRQINDLSGKGFLNDAFDLIKKNAERLKDDKALGGGNKDLIDQLFGLSAQDIINKFQLTGDAFQEFIKQFPELAGKLKEFDDVAGKMGLKDRIFNANLGDSDADKRAAFERNAERERLEAAKKGSEYLILLEQALGAERARLEREIQERIMEERRSLEDRLFNANNDTSTLAGKLAEFDRKAAREREEAAKRGNNNVVDAEKIITIGRLEVMGEFKNNVLQLEKEINKGRLEVMGDGLNRLGAPIQDRLGAPINKGRPDVIGDGKDKLIQDGIDNILLLDEVLARERLRIIEEFNKAALEAEQKRIQTFRDRLFAATNDATTLEGQLAAFDRQARREREEEAKAGGGAMVDLELALAAERFNIIKNFNDRAIEEEKRAAEDRQRAIESAAKNIADYLKNLITGPSSTLSPSDRFAAAQTQYNATLVLAQGGNTDALQKITEDAENYRTAAREMFASGAGYQSVFQQILSQLSGLPAVASSTDPVVQSILDLIGVVQDGIDTQATEATLAGAVKNAIDAGNASQTAASLLPMFNNLNTTVDAGLTLSELQAAGLFTTSGGQAIFNELDVNGDQHLSKLELVRAASESTKNAVEAHTLLLQTLNNLSDAVRLLIVALNNFVGGGSTDSLKNLIVVTNSAVAGVSAQVAGVQASVDVLVNQRFVDTNFSLDGMRARLADLNFNTDLVLKAVAAVRDQTVVLNTAVANVQTSVNSVNAAIGTGQGDGSLQALNTTANATLKLLNTQLNYTGALYTVTDRSAPFGINTTVTFPNNLIDVLGMIAFNTYSTAFNTALLVSAGASTINAKMQWPVRMAEGGVIPPFGLGLVSEHLNPTFLRAGAEPITVSPFSPANDNGQWSAVLAELRELRKEVASFRKENGVNTMNAARHVGERVDVNTDAVREDSNTQATKKRQDHRSRKFA